MSNGTEIAIAEIRAARDSVLQGINAALNAVGNEIAQTAQTGPYLDALTKRYEDLRSERAAIFAAATEAVLSLPGVVAAVGELSGLAQRMTQTAGELPQATKLLQTASSILSLGQQFANTVANAQK
jgi:hypothetical protein